MSEFSIPEGVAKIGDGAFDAGRNILLYVEKGSYAHDYAEENRINFIFS